MTDLNDYSETTVPPHSPAQFVSGIEALALLRDAGIKVSKDVFYRELSNLPGAVRLGRNWHVPMNIVDRLANPQT